MKKLAVAASVATGAVAVLSNHNAEASTQHTVKSGESLWSIASKYNTSVDSIKKSNNLSNNMIFPGQVISIGARVITLTMPVQMQQLLHQHIL